MQLERKQVKLLLETSTSFERADEILSNYAGLKSLKEKIAYLRGMVDVEIRDDEEDDPDELTYRILLTTAIDMKWRGLKLSD